MSTELIEETKFYLEGKVVYGEQRGRTIGFPTANIDFSAPWLEKGVYGVHIKVNDFDYYGVMNIGVKPTFHKSYEKSIEVHIIDFNQNIYGEFVQVKVLYKIRNEQKFNNIQELKAQINKDIETAKSLIMPVLNY
ncbi:riboflavin kinase [Bacillus salipaludis]|uniref:riboflavin kinase n=1 Tax=Bacillus salipaludis TaxID=2547811 RepID=A0AA90Z634_9BACI|nr:riboflavin kinase [Bacillus salipaludis]MDQ6600954.1 riboflavin kinase [Bacillus salipaludis]